MTQAMNQYFEDLRQLLNVAVARGCFNDSSAVVVTHNALQGIAAEMIRLEALAKNNLEE